jgi:hypothetical protein
MTPLPAVLALATLLVTPRGDTSAELARLRQALGLPA